MSIKVFIIDDSAVVRQVLGEYIRKDPEMELIGFAQDPIFAMDKMQSNWPDVIILDIEMPRMDGLTFLRRIMKERPTPVVICSSLAEENSDTALQALREGALDIITKPKVGLKGFLDESSEEITQAIKAAYLANLRSISENLTNLEFPLQKYSKKPQKRIEGMERIIAIGASTGGTIALEKILSKLDPNSTPGIVVVQHMPEKFTESFAKRLDQISPLVIKEAIDSERIFPGHVYIAPGNRHLQIRRSGTQFFTQVSDGPLVNRHRPSVDVLFRSVAREAGKNAVGIIMTGMGDDGASGLLEMRRVGAYTIAQSEDTCIVFGMPKEAIRRGAVDAVLPLEKISKAMLTTQRRTLLDSEDFV